MEMTKEQFDAAVAKAVAEANDAKFAELKADFDKKLEAIEVKKANLRQEMQEVYEASELERESKGYKPETAEIKLAKLINVYANAKGDTGYMDKLAAKMYPEDKEIAGYIKKTLEAGTPSAGGFGIPNVLSSRVIDILYANTVLDKIGVTRMPMPNGNLRMMRMDTASSVGWVGELPSTAPTEPVFGDVSLNSKKLFAYTEISNSLIKYNETGIEAWVARELQRRAKIKLDYTAFYGTGTSYTPAGLNVISGVQTIGSTTTLLTSQIPDTIVALLKQANVLMSRPAWAMSPKMESWIMKLQTTTGAWVFRDEMVSKKTLCGIPYFVTTQISYTDTTHDYGDLWLGDWDEFLWGVGRDLELQMSNEASFVSGGTTYSAFQRDTTLVKIVAEHDFNVMHPAAFVHAIYAETVA